MKTYETVWTTITFENEILW